MRKLYIFNVITAFLKCHTAKVRIELNIPKNIYLYQSSLKTILGELQYLAITNNTREGRIFIKYLLYARHFIHIFPSNPYNGLV